MLRFTAVVVLAALSGLEAQRAPAERGYRLESLTWVDAEPLLTAQAVVVIPLAPASSEHGPHLSLRTDLAIAEYLAGRLVQASPVVMAPPVPYDYVPGLFEYAGSTTLGLTTAQNVIVEVVRSLARYGPRRFYVVGTSPSAERVLEPAAAVLAGEGVLLRFARYGALLEQASRGIRQQPVVGHADEVETSILLHAAPGLVDIAKAVRDFSPGPAFGRLTRRRDIQALYSPSGTWGDPTLATRDKGRVIVESLVASLIGEIDSLRRAEVPAASAAAPAAPARAAPAAPTPAGAGPEPDGCDDADARTIRAIGDAFSVAWAAADAQRLGGLWSTTGNIVHPDGLVERGSVAITQARTQLFSRRDYRGSRHLLTLSMVRCLASSVAVADGRWDLRGLTTTAGAPVPTLEGFCTLVVRKNGGTWQIEAYRYTVTTPTVAVPPNVLKRPGYPGGV